MPMLTNNVKVLVTGASSGIGLGICQTLTKHGARVVGTGRNRDLLSKLKADGVIEDFMVADLSSPTSSADGIRPCKFVVDKAAELLGGLTTVVNSAGVIQTGAMGDVTIDNYDFNMNTNKRASFEIMTHAIPYLREAAASTKSGEISCAPSIVNISSVNGKQSFQGCTAYCMSKAAVDMMTKCASIDLAKDGIRVNSVNPGVIITNIHKRGGLSDEQYDAFIKRQIEVTHPLGSFLGRCGTTREVGELVAFLISDNAQFISGECIAIDGGRQNLGAR